MEHIAIYLCDVCIVVASALIVNYFRATCFDHLQRQHWFPGQCCIRQGGVPRVSSGLVTLRCEENQAATMLVALWSALAYRQVNSYYARDFRSGGSFRRLRRRWF